MPVKQTRRQRDAEVSAPESLVEADAAPAVAHTDRAPSVRAVAAGVIAGHSPLRRHGGGDALGGTAVDAGISDALRRRRGRGTELPSDMAGALSQHFGHDLTGVRVHHDSEAGDIAQSLESTAFTHGTDVYFAPGAYQPGSAEGQRVIAHELSHVVAQQTGADRGGSGPLTVGRANDPAEAAADRSADGAVTALRRMSAGGDPLRRSLGPAEGARGDVDGTPVRRLKGLSGLFGRKSKGSAPTESAPKEPNTSERGSGSFSGTTVEKNDVDQSISDRAGGFTGRSKETTTQHIGGMWNKGETESDVRNGKSQVVTKTSHDDLVGGEAWIKTIKSASDTELLAAFQARARGGAFSSRSGETSYKRGEFEAGIGGGYDAMVGGDTGVSGHAKVDMSGLLPALEAAGEAYVKGGAGFDANVNMFARLWKLEFVATGNVSTFAGFEAKAKGRAFASLEEGVGVEGSGEFFAGLRGEASGEAHVKLGPAELVALASVAGKAGVWGSASGKVAIGFDGVEISGAAEFFAGVEASAGGSVAAKFRGKTIASASGKVTVAAGIGGKVEGAFSFKGGKLKVKVGALAVKGIGGGFDLDGEIDFFALGNAIGTMIWEQYANYTNEVSEDAGYIPRDVIVDEQERARVEQQGYDTYLADFRAYAAQKLAGSGSTGLNKERVQKILDDRRGQLGMALTHVETDIGIRKAAKEAFGPLLRDIVVRAGKIQAWDALLLQEGGIATVRVDEAKKSATGALQAALVADATALRSAGNKKSGPTHQPSQDSINKVLAKQGKGLITACQDQAKNTATLEAKKALEAGGPAQTKAQTKAATDQASVAGAADADAVMEGLIEEVYQGIFTHVVVKNGQMSSAVIDMSAVTRANAEAEKARATSARMAALGQLQGECAAYAAKLAKSADKPVKLADVETIIAKYVGAIGQAASDSTVADRLITEMVVAGLGASVKEFSYANGAVRYLTPADPAEVNKAYLADAAAQARKKIYDGAMKKFTAYASEKTKTGEHGVKYAKVKAIVDSVIKEVGPQFRGEADEALTAALQTGLGSMVEEVYVKDGELRMVALPDKVAAIKDEYAQQKANRGRRLGEDEANERRYTVRKAVYNPLKTYAEEVLADPRGIVEVARIQAIINKELGTRKDVLTKEDARQYLEQIIDEVFAGIVSVKVSEQGALTYPVINLNVLIDIRQRRSAQAASKKAAAALAPKLRAYAAKVAKSRPSRDGIEAVIASVQDALSGLSDEQLDDFLTIEVMSVFGTGWIKKLRFERGRIMEFGLAK